MLNSTQNESISSVEVIEQLKDVLTSRIVGAKLLSILSSAIAQHSSTLTHRIHGELLLIALARHCIECQDSDAIIKLCAACRQKQEIGRFTPLLKEFLLSNIVNTTTITGLFELALSDPEVTRICRIAAHREIVPDLPSLSGLRYDKWREYCQSVATHLDPELQTRIAHQSQDSVPEPDTTAITNLNSSSSTLSAADLQMFERIKLLPNIENSVWYRLLKSPDYSTRCIAAELVGIYVSSGKFQDTTLRMLMSSRTQISREIYLRAISYSYIALIRKSSKPPAKFPGESFSQHHDVVLQLTQQQAQQQVQQAQQQAQQQVQQQAQPLKTQHYRALPNSESSSDIEDGVWSYLNCFQGHCLLFISLVDAFREGDRIALFASHQFQYISKVLGRTPWQLCQPYWTLLAPKIVKHYSPKFVDWFCSNVLRVSRQDFLLRMSGIIIPHLCQAGKQQMKVCEEIAGYKGCSVRRLYIDSTAPIIAMLLMSSSTDVELAWSYAQDRFMSLDRSFRSLQFGQILASWRVDAIYEVLMLTTEKNASLAIGMVNKIMECAYLQHDGEHRELLEQTVFKLVVKFSETMRNLMGRQSQLTKLSALTGLKILIDRFLTPELVASVLRQLTAFLQAALEDNLLSISALRAWLAVVRKLHIDKLEAIVDLSYAIINEHVDTWDKDSIMCAREIVHEIQKTLRTRSDGSKIYPQSVFDTPSSSSSSTTVAAAANVPGATGGVSTPGNPNSGEAEGFAPFDILLSLVERDTENTYLAQQTARDLCALSLEYQDDIITWAQETGEAHNLLGQAVRVLLNLCTKNNIGLKQLSARALGLFGALDPHNTVIDPKESQMIMLHNFQNSAEVVNFSRVLVQDWFLPAFEAAIDPAQQRYYAYGIQELLRFMGIEEENKLRMVFKDSGIINTLVPLIKTKYTTDMKHWAPPTYPLYENGKPYLQWLIVFCSDMMDRIVDSEYATRIFTWCRKVLYGSNAGPEMWAFLFPYAALVAVVDSQDTAANREVFISEILLVLKTAGRHMQAFHERIFACFDYFNQWMRLRRQAKLSILNMDTLLDRLPSQIMAQRALESGAYPRAIRYFEQHVREQPEDVPLVLQDLRQIYATMQDVDALEGVSSRMPTLSIEQQLLEYRATSQWDAALACYNALPATDENIAATLECLHRSGREKDVLSELSVDTASSSLASVGAECAWFVRDWAALEKWTSLIDTDQVTIGRLPSEAVQALGHSLLFLRKKNWDGFKHSLETGRKYVGTRLGEIMSTHNVTSLRQVRELMVYLHGLADIESLGTMVMPGYTIDESQLQKASTARIVKEQLDLRLSVLSPLSEGPEFESRRYLLALRAAALDCIADSFKFAPQLIADSHLSISTAARHHGQPSIALMEIATAKYYNNDKADIEHARLLWSEGESRSAIRMLQSQIPVGFFEKPRQFPEYASQALDWTLWRDLTAQADTKVIVDNYSAVIKAAPQMAEAQYRLAKHYVKIFDESSQVGKNDGSLNRAIVYHFCKALELGTSRSNEALPKMLTTWFDLGINPKDLSPQEKSSRKHCLTQVNKEIQAWGKVIDKKLVYTAIPQLLSRHNHPSKAVKTLVEQLIILVLQKYPHHTLWSVLEKGDGATELLDQACTKLAKTEQKKFTSLVKVGTDFVEKLRRVCALKPKPKEMKLREFGEDFSACLKTPILAVPVQHTMDGLEDIFIYQIEERVIIQQSLQKPKRIVVWGTDGKRYQLLLKGNDDVRKDARLIEFTTAVNALLKSDPASASRHLDILTYRVTPIGANAGIIEWVEGATPARSIIQSLSRDHNLSLGSPDVKKMTNTSVRISERLNAFNSLQKAVPPVLWEWFVDTFPDPEAWLDARTRYARTLAVMSMVGYILGLGDRHLENILLVQSSGAVLHVDFDCLFDKGRHLAVPELVPFRLTQQFQDALGVINNYEGPFRKVSELTLKIIRENEDLLLVVLEAFIYDPVVQDRINLMEPRQTIERLSAKIRGIREPNSVPLSVGGLVDELIQIAISPENLCQLFKGWMPWV